MHQDVQQGKRQRLLGLEQQQQQQQVGSLLAEL
jgi:hypothetical protein